MSACLDGEGSAVRSASAAPSLVVGRRLRGRPTTSRGPDPAPPPRWADFESAREEFWSYAHHELRTPLTSIVGYTELLSCGEAGTLSPTQAAMVARIETNSDTLLALLDQLLCRTALEGRVESVG